MALAIVSPIPCVLDTVLDHVEIDVEQMQIPDITYACSVHMPSKKLERAVRNLRVFDEKCTISASSEDELKFCVQGAVGSHEIAFRVNAAPEKEEDEVTIDMKEPVDLRFALDPLDWFTEATPLASTVHLCLSGDLPLLVEYRISGNGHVRFYLAPVVCRDEMEDDE
jgi:proliferating cell nuclear antigen